MIAPRKSVAHSVIQTEIQIKKVSTVFINLVVLSHT